MAWKDSIDCALCGKKLSSQFRIYFGPFLQPQFVTTCGDCYSEIDEEFRKARNECMQRIFKDRLFTFQQGPR